MKSRLLWAFAFASAGLAQVSESFGGNIVLGRPTDRSITVNALFMTDQDTVYLEYGEKSGTLDKADGSSSGDQSQGSLPGDALRA